MEHEKIAGLKAQWDTEQDTMMRDLVYTWDDELVVSRVGGVDISFMESEEEVEGGEGRLSEHATPPSNACVCLVVLSYPDLKPLYKKVSVIHLSLPYIPSYLAFREAPSIVIMLEELRRESPSLYPDVLLVDGNGILHPRGLGLASHVGILASLPTIGIAKTFFNIDGLTVDEVRERHRSVQFTGDAGTSSLDGGIDSEGVVRTKNAVSYLIGSSGKSWGAAFTFGTCTKVTNY